jgi:hypothetical protein
MNGLLFIELPVGRPAEGGPGGAMFLLTIWSSGALFKWIPARDRNEFAFELNEQEIIILCLEGGIGMCTKIQRWPDEFAMLAKEKMFCWYLLVWVVL